MSLSLIVAVAALAASEADHRRPAAPPTAVPDYLQRRARAIDPGSWIGSSDYPLEALRNDAEGTVLVRYTVNSGGRIEGCDILESSGVEALDRASCALLTARARFEPARGARGERIASVVRQRIMWKYPEQADPVPYRPGRIIILAPVERDGVPVCDVWASDAALESLGWDLCVEGFPLDGAGPDAPMTGIATLSDGNAAPPLPSPLAAPLLESAEARFTIETDGRVTGCTAEGSPDLASSLCHLLHGRDGEAPYFQSVPSRRAARLQLRIHRGRIPARP